MRAFSENTGFHTPLASHQEPRLGQVLLLSQSLKADASALAADRQPPDDTQGERSSTSRPMLLQGKSAATGESGSVPLVQYK
jgi:hypothetical protein